ncbi:HAD-IA family hydrolase [Lactobacillus sp. S2-2]|uniref:HAD family hydrolase n=1 Tax=Lactobacillus sp. S2-2 TaxID=2692917 RepID=UPI001F360EFB|nr:HAD family phosphatase [Lactobacillus sp. S2-2]MCF6515612.1 HAD-IA family hydrolase [Lactobacillus sp. S2-2]
MIKSVIFDMDGLLIDSEKVYYNLFESVLNKYGKNITLDDYVKLFSGRTFSENVSNLIDWYDLPADKKEVLKYFNDEGEKLAADDFDLKLGAKELLVYLKENNYIISLATSNNNQIADGILQRNGIFDYFEFKTYGNEVKNGKPNPEIFLTSVNKTSVPKEDTVILEDSENGITAAHEAGVKVIGIPDMKMPSDKHQAMTYKVCHNLNEVKDLLAY